uniref:Uncharacterized protein n=1 Tax=Octopus bimaculoides TaxID=37653 RepID=A0A0L8HUT9_OCTBM
MGRMKDEVNSKVFEHETQKMLFRIAKYLVGSKGHGLHSLLVIFIFFYRNPPFRLRI